MLIAKELKQKSVEELGKLLTEKRRGLWNFRFGVTGSKVRNVKEGSELRRDIARILGAMNELQSKK